jgi:hypothetical protein
MKKLRTQILKVSYEFNPSGPTEAVEFRRELDQVFDALFDMVLKAESDTLDSHEMCNKNNALPIPKSTVDNSV